MSVGTGFFALFANLKKVRRPQPTRVRGCTPVLSEPWPLGMLLRDAGVGYEIVLSLDVPVPEMGEKLPNIVHFFAAQLPVVAELVVEVPKILLDRTPQRLGDRLRRPQMVEHLVDVPTVVSYSSLQQLTAEQIVDFPVPGRAGGGERGGLQGFLPRQDSAAFYVEQTVDIPVPRSGGLQGSRPGQGSTASSSHVGAADGAGQGVFRTFPQLKKVRVGSALGVGTGCGLYSMDSGGLCRVHGVRGRRV